MSGLGDVVQDLGGMEGSVCLILNQKWALGKIQMPPVHAHSLRQHHPSIWNGKRGKHGGLGTVGIAWHKGLTIKGVWIPPLLVWVAEGRGGQQ